MKSESIKANILVLNCGSSSLKYKVIRMPEGAAMASGEAERVGIRTKEPPRITHTFEGRTRTLQAPMPDHASAFRKVMELLSGDLSGRPGEAITAFGHRFVHPWTFFDKTTRVDDSAFEKLKKTLPLAPIHNPISFSLIEICRNEFPAIPQYVVFDTAFHARIPEELRAYALPARMVKKHGLRRYGFHGISFQYVTREACRLLNRPFETQKIIGCHLGTGGSSVCGVKNGRSVMTSLGFTPLEGLIMNTRSGDLDLGFMFYLMFRENLSCDAIETILNKKSGVFGLFGESSDLRDVALRRESDPAAVFALDMYARRVRKYISYAGLLLEKADILVFTDTLGAGLPVVREEICRGLSFLGIGIDPKKNAACLGTAADISAEGSETRVLVVPTDEEIMIARETYQEMSHDPHH